MVRVTDGDEKMTAKEILNDIANCAADIARWCLLCAIDGRISRDRHSDMLSQAKRIVRILEKSQ